MSFTADGETTHTVGHGKSSVQPQLIIGKEEITPGKLVCSNICLATNLSLILDTTSARPIF